MPSSLNWIFTVEMSPPLGVTGTRASLSSNITPSVCQVGQVKILRGYLQDGRAQDRSRCHRGRGPKMVNPVTVLPVTDGQVSSEWSVILPILLVAPW